MGYADASQKGYGASTYLYKVDSEEKIHVYFIAYKIKVAPLKVSKIDISLTIPLLEPLIPVDKLHPLTGITPPHIHRKITSEMQRMKQITDERQRIYNTQIEGFQLKSRKSFLKCAKMLKDNPQTER
ncbi:hypothetical protein QTP88_003796 [Uroleucon formosanum]